MARSNMIPTIKTRWAATARYPPLVGSEMSGHKSWVGTKAASPNSDSRRHLMHQSDYQLVSRVISVMKQKTKF